MTHLVVKPIVGQRTLLPGRVQITLSAGHRRAYLLLYGGDFPLADVPALKDTDFDGRSIRMSSHELAALNRMFQALGREADPGPAAAFRGQERSLTGTSRRMQFLS